MKLSATMSGLGAALDAADIKARMGAMKAMTRAGDSLKEDLRDQVIAAGFSDRLARTWQGRIYPSGGKASLEPAALVFSKAPGIIESYAKGATIVAKAGRRFLALPTDETPEKRNGRALNPAEVEARFGKKLRFVPRSTAQGSQLGRAVGFLVLDGVVPRKANGRIRNASARELKGGSRNKVRPPQFVVMFTLVASVKVPKKLDLTAALGRAQTTLSELLAQEWGDA